MNFVNEYRLQTYFGALQILLGLVSWVWTGTLLKFFGFYTPDDRIVATIIRNSAVFLLALPLLWVVYTIKKERNLDNRWTKVHTVISGVLVAVFLIYAMSWAVDYGKVTDNFFIKNRRS